MTRRTRWKPINKKAHLTYHLPTAETLELVEKQKLTDLASFVKYYLPVKHLGFEKAFHTWWVFYGPTGFYKPTDRAKYKSELKSFVITKLESAGVTDEQVHTS